MLGRLFEREPPRELEILDRLFERELLPIDERSLLPDRLNMEPRSFPPLLRFGATRGDGRDTRFCRFSMAGARFTGDRSMLGREGVDCRMLGDEDCRGDGCVNRLDERGSTLGREMLSFRLGTEGRVTVERGDDSNRGVAWLRSLGAVRKRDSDGCAEGVSRLRG